jgi:hypothetical protein
VSTAQTSSRLVRLYPKRWRERYGQEMEALIVESSGEHRVSWRMRVDVARGAGREQLRSAGLADSGAPGDQVRAGVLLVLCAWSLFVVGGIVVQKFSEHWQSATSAAGRGTPSTAFATLMVAAICASALVLVGLACATPGVVSVLRGGGWPDFRRRVVTAALLTGLAFAAMVALVVWAHRLTADERAGRDGGYAVTFVIVACLVVACLIAWTLAAAAISRRLSLSPRTLRTETYIACAVTVLMAVMVASTIVWWAAIAAAAPWFLAGGAVGATGSPIAAQLVIATVVMALAVLLGVAGTRKALRGIPAITGRPPNRRP